MLKKTYLLTMILTMYVLAASAEIAEYKLSFDKEARNYRDASGALSLSLEAGGVKWVKDTDSGGALFFDGTGGARIILGKGAGFSAEKSFTIDVWCKPIEGGDERQAIVSATGTGKSYWLCGLFSKGRLGVRAEMSKDWEFKVLDGKDSVGCRRHMTFVKDAKENLLKYYLNGNLIKETPFTAGDNTLILGESLNLGGAFNGCGCFRGMIEAVAVSKGVRIESATDKEGNLTVYAPFTAKTQTPDPALDTSWAELDKFKLNVVPAPKRINVKGILNIGTDWRIVLKEPAAASGVEEINLQIVAHNGKVLQKDATEPAGNRIVIGTFEQLPEILKPLGSPEKLGPQGYLIDSYRLNGKTTVVIAGGDVDGVRYGCVTLSMLIKDGPTLCDTRIADFPDFKKRMAFSAAPYNGLAEVKTDLDQAFRAKINLVWGKGFTEKTDFLLARAGLIREASDYAADRGISIVLGGSVNVEDAPMPKDMKDFGAGYYPYKSDEGLIGHRGKAFTWSRDDLLDKKGELWTELMVKSGVSSFYLHSMDTGARENPENWKNRTPMDLKRWGDDRAAADANIINRIYAPLKRANPSANIFYVEYPYGASYLKYPEVADWLKRLSELIPADVYFCQREGSRAGVEKWKNSTRQGIFMYHDPYPSEYRLLYAATGRYAATFKFQDRETVYWFLQGKDFQAASVWTAAEYAWNNQAPGWDWFPDNDRLIQAAESVPAEIEKRLLPRIAAILLGETAAGEMSEVLMTRLSCNIPLTMQKFSVENPEAYFKTKYENAFRAKAIIAGSEQKINLSGRKFFEIIKNFVSAAAILNEARYRYFAARRLVSEEKLDEAEMEITRARETIRKLNDNDRMAMEKDLDFAVSIKWVREKKKYAQEAKRRKVSLGVYAPNGFPGGVLDSFAGIENVTAKTFDNPTTKELAKYNVIFFPATTDMWDMTEDWKETVPEFVKKGGVVIFSHNAIGKYAKSALGKPLFPEIFAGYGGTVSGDNRKLSVVSDDNILGSLKKGDSILYRYSDHCWGKPGPRGKILMVDSSGNPVMIVGEHGKGRVIYTGQIFGYGSDGRAQESTGDEWKLLFNIGTCPVAAEQPKP